VTGKFAKSKASSSSKASEAEEEHEQAADSQLAAGGQDEDIDSDESHPPKPLVVASKSPLSENLQVAMGMLVMMQRTSFDRLSVPIQEKMVDLASVMDQRAYDYACKNLDHQKTTRNIALAILSGFALLLILIGTSFAAWMFYKDKLQEAQALILTGIGLIGALLGGAGLQGVLKNLGGQ
jgi:hypothetical protein